VSHQNVQAMRRTILLSAILLGTSILSSCQTSPSASSSPESSSESSSETELPAIQTVDSNSAEEQAYRALEGHKAEAIALTLTQIPLEKRLEPPARFNYQTSGHPNPSAAALAALKACEEARAGLGTPTYRCELRRRGDQHIHNTWELTQGLAADRPGFIWQVEHKDTLIYLAGSIHLLKPTLKAPPSYMEAFERSSVLVLEVDQRNQTPEELQTLTQNHMLLPEGKTLSQLLTAEELERVQDYLQGIGGDLATANVLKPAALLVMAGTLEYTSIGYLPDHGIEKTFESKLGNRKLLGLETMAQQFAAATALPLPLQAELLMETIDQADSAPEQISALVRAWLSGDKTSLSDQFEEATTSVAATQWMEELLFKRNQGMANGIDSLLRGTDQRLTDSGVKTIFVVVGAGHLVGDNSVVELLEQKGYALKRLKFSGLLPVE